MRKVLLAAFCILTAISCGRRQKEPVMPMLLGVPEYRVEQHIVDMIGEAQQQSLAEGCAAIENLFDSIEAEERRDSTRHAYLRLTELVSKYLYDPNSPLRDEDLYLPFLRRMLESPFTVGDMIPAYTYEASMCALNPRESQAADFKFRTADGRNRTLHSLDTDYILLFFSNPGCEACRDIIDAIVDAQFPEKMIGQGRLTILDIYIDEDLKAWREYLPAYPNSWICAYDPDYIIRQDLIYNVRAIPSLYLLGPGKTVVLKDADTDRMLRKLSEINNNLI